MKRTHALQLSAFAIACAFLSATGAGAGEWAVADGGCKVWNPNPTPGETAYWTGACKNGFVEGVGALEWRRGGKSYERDEGLWRGGRQAGEGSQTWPGGQFKGQLADSMPQGQGVLILGETRYEGAFLSGKPHGRGALTNASGVFDGAWRDGCFNDGKRRAAFGVALQSCP
ncbi:MAG: hypothetical protein WAN43_04950 [Rhodomicrobium sp.]|jgi:hypothetical protein